MNGNHQLCLYKLYELDSCMSWLHQESLRKLCCLRAMLVVLVTFVVRWLAGDSLTVLRRFVLIFMHIVKPVMWIEDA